MELELIDQELQLGFRLGISGQYEFAAVCGREMDVDHLDRGELLDSAAGAQPRRQRMQAALQRDVRTIGQEGDKDMGLDPAFLVMEDRSDGEISLQVFEGFFDGDELDVVLPESRGSPSVRLVRSR